jgi:hypothetical protein
LELIASAGIIAALVVRGVVVPTHLGAVFDTALAASRHGDLKRERAPPP